MQDRELISNGYDVRLREAPCREEREPSSHTVSPVDSSVGSATATVTVAEDEPYRAECMQRGRKDVEPHPFDGEYVRKLADGDPAIECHFVEYFSALLLAKLRFHLRCGQDVQDLRQEVFLRVLRALRQGGGVQKPERLGAFVNAVCNNVMLEHYRYKSRVIQLDENAPEPRDIRTDLEQELVSGQNQERVRSMVAELAPKDRRILKAIFLDERDKDSVCREFGVTRSYLRVLLHRAKERFRRLTSAQQSIPGGLLSGA